MKRQKVLGFTGAMMVGASLLLGACNKHSYEDGEFDKGVKRLYEKHHSGGEGHGDDHGKGHDSGHGDAHEHGKEAKHHDEKSDVHSKEAGHHKADEGKGHQKEEAPKKPAKSLFPKK